MTDKELRRLSRTELLELLLKQMKENKELKSRLELAQESLADRDIHISHAGSIAEAALQLSGIFDTAQEVADQYLENVRRLSADQEMAGNKIEEEARKRADEIKARAEEYSRNLHMQADDYWAKVRQQAEKLLQEHSALSRLIETEIGGCDI